MDGLELLRALTAHAEASTTQGMPPSALRFIIEYEGEVDLAVERARVGELVGTDAFEFRALFDPDDDPDDDEFGEFYLAQFAGLDRTMTQPQLFSVAHELKGALGAITVEPDLGTEVYQQPAEPGSAAEAAQVGDAFGRLCFVDDDAPANRHWALDKMNVPAAWAINPTKGAGIRVAQPDTGITDHPELRDGAISADQFSVFTGANDATDPMQKGNTGHGTGTGSVVVSRENLQMSGSAPGAELVPIRCIESVIIKFNAGPVAEAINYARTNNCHVVTMSLGGTPSRAVKKAIKKAVKADMIVLAAAGNCVGIVVWPARYDQVIAVAGSNADDGEWKGSSRGGDVDITAPGENVWKAATDENNHTEVLGGQGTSFATALTAGVAALWLSHHGRANLIAAAATANTSVQELFRHALRTTARTPNGWDTGNFGAGVVDAAALLQHPIAGLPVQIPAAAPGLESVGLASEVGNAESATRIAAASPQFDLEISALLLDDARRGIDPGSDVGAEAQTARMPMSPQLEAALGKDALGGRPPIGGVSAPVVVTGAVQAGDPAVLIAPPSTSQLEAVTPLSASTARAALANAIENRVSRLTEVAGPNSDALIASSREVLHMVARGDELPTDALHRTSLEALVAMDGTRPAIALTGGPIDTSSNEVGQWDVKLLLLGDQLVEKQKSVGRIDAIPGTHSGTGFVVGDGLVLTNRHVLEALAIPAPRAENPKTWIIPNESTINFSPSAFDTSQSFVIEEVVFAGPNEIGRGAIDLANLDVALLRVRTSNDAGTQFPAPLALSKNPNALSAGRQLFVMGYPAMPSVLPKDEDGRTRMDVVQELRKIYGTDYGQKHLSPGLVLTAADHLDQNPRGWVFTHDATSLGGNSGSCILSADDDLSIVGLHFAGDWLRANFAHDMARIRGEFDQLLS